MDGHNFHTMNHWEVIIPFTWFIPYTLKHIFQSLSKYITLNIIIKVIARTCFFSCSYGKKNNYPGDTTSR